MANITKNNITQFFNPQKIYYGSIKPGMLLQFGYQSPGGVHDLQPLIYVVEIKNDRVWGLNLHYRFNLMAEIVNSKKEELKKATKESSPTTQTKKEPEESIISSLPKLKSFLPIKPLPSLKSQIKPKPSLKTPAMQAKNNQPIEKTTVIDYGKVNLEIFTLNTKPEIILRNYLPKRLNNLQKLIYRKTI